MKNILMTGGHAGSTAHAIIEEIHRQNKNWNIFFTGNKYAIEGKRLLTYEAEVLNNIGCKFIPMVSGRIQRKFTLWTIPSFLKIPLGFIQALFIIIKVKPCLIITFGGSSSFSIVFWGWLMKIPIILHEQTAVAGRSNQVAARFASVVALSRESSIKYIKGNKVVITGNPILNNFCSIDKKYLSKKPVLFITGGSRGSEIINKVVIESIDVLLKDFIVIHQTGRKQEKYINNIAKSLNLDKSCNYQIYGFLQPDQYLKVFSQTDIIISRSGANSVSQIIAGRVPSVLIPIPFSYLNEQYQNALFLNKEKGCVLLPQKDLSKENLIKAVSNIKNRWEYYKNNLRNIKNIDCEASKKIVFLADQMLK